MPKLFLTFFLNWLKGGIAIKLNALAIFFIIQSVIMSSVLLTFTGLVFHIYFSPLNFIVATTRGLPFVLQRGECDRGDELGFMGMSELGFLGLEGFMGKDLWEGTLNAM